MKIHEFLQNIHYLSNDDIKQFEKFLLSPYFNNLQSLNIVYRIIKRNLSYISQKKFEELKSIIINETKYSEATVRKILSYLNERYIDYVKMQAFNSNEFKSEYLSCNYLLLKGNYNLLNKRIHKIDMMLSESENIDEDIFLKLFESNILNYNILSTSEDILNPISKLEKQKSYTNESSKNLIVYTLLKTTINYVNFVIQCNDSNKTDNNIYPIDLAKLFNIISAHEYDLYNNIQKTTINLFLKIFKLFNNPSKDKYYDDYNNYYSEVKSLYTLEFHKTQVSILLGYCILRQRTNDKSMFYASEVLSILFEYIENGFYKNVNTEYLHPLMYRNYVKNCLDLEKKDILLKFIDTQTEKLNPSEIEHMKKFGMSHFYYLAKDYRSSLEYAESIVNPKFLYKYDIYNLTIRNCFELNNYEKIENILHNYKEYIRKDDFLSKYAKERHNYFVYCMKKFLTAYYKYETKQSIFEFEYLLKIINTNPNFALKKWLYNKVTIFITEHYKKYKVISSDI